MINEGNPQEGEWDEVNLSHRDRELIGLGFYAVLNKLDNIECTLSNLEDQIHHLRHMEADEIMDLSALQASVAAQSTVIASAETLLSTLAQEIRDAAGDPAAIAALADTIDQNSAGLAEAVKNNTDPTAVPPAAFVTKIDGESFVDYQTRLFIYNEGKPTDQQAPVLSEADWDAAPVG